MYEELPSNESSTSRNVNAPLLPVLPPRTSAGQRPHPQYGHSSGSGNKAARVIATSLSCIYTMWCMMKFFVFLISELTDNEHRGHNSTHVSNYTGFGPTGTRSHKFNESPDDPTDQYKVGIAGALFLASVVGSFGIFAAGCSMACAKKCGCHSSLFKTSNLAKVQLAGSVVCTLVAFGWMIFVAEWCRSGGSGGGASNHTNHTSSGPQLHPTMHSGDYNTHNSTQNTHCFWHSYWMREGPMWGLAGWGIIDAPVCVVLLGCTCVSVF